MSSSDCLPFERVSQAAEIGSAVLSGRHDPSSRYSDSAATMLRIVGRWRTSHHPRHWKNGGAHCASQEHHAIMQGKSARGATDSTGGEASRSTVLGIILARTKGGGS